MVVLAEDSTVPVTVPFAARARPGGRLVAENDKVSLSGSENEEAIERLTKLEIAEIRLERFPATGLRLPRFTVHVKEADTVPPLPSLAVIRVV